MGLFSRIRDSRLYSGAFFSLSLTITGLAPGWCSSPNIKSIKLPPGFTIDQYAEAPGARSLALGSEGTVFVGTRGEDKVYALTDADGDHKAETVRVIAEGLDTPNGVAFRDGDLYVAEVNRILRFPGIEARLDDPPPFEVVTDAYPEDRHHGWKYIAFGPDGLLYVPVGAPCNVCEREEPYASITRLNVDTGQWDVFASGIRNTVGFDWRPSTGVFWFTNNGRDWMGDTKPPDSLHRAPAPGLNFGFPSCHAGVPDPEYGQGVDCSEFAPAQLLLPAHCAPLGMVFYDGDMFPERYRERIFIAEHGSWNRATPTGYRLSMASFKQDGAMKYEIFISGWLQDGEAWGRPVDVLILHDGSLLVSDDRAGRIYRISYQ
jgi:glucose/arabinose dehydrogenase